MDKSQKNVKILSVKVTSTTPSEVLNYVSASLNKHKFFITTPNPEIIVKAQKDRQLRDAINSSDIALPDGVGVIYAAKFLGIELKDRISGREIFEELLGLANEKGLKVFLLGASKEVNAAAIEKIKKEYPKIKVQGSSDIKINNKAYSDTDRDIKSHIETIKHINIQKPDLLFVALGAPKQEKWVMHNLLNLDIGGAMVVGGAFDYFVGKMSKPPAIFARLGLEWLWRVLLEPKRTVRIFNAVVVFPYLVLKNKISS